VSHDGDIAQFANHWIIICKGRVATAGNKGAALYRQRLLMSEFNISLFWKRGFHRDSSLEYGFVS
jgi:hypothetical protein